MSTNVTLALGATNAMVGLGGLSQDFNAHVKSCSSIGIVTLLFVHTEMLLLTFSVVQ